MTYATSDDLAKRTGLTELRQIADRDGLGSPDPEAIASALAQADTVIDGYVGVKYALPLATVPDLLTTWAVSIARYTLHSEGAPEHVADDYKDAIRSLKDVARGLITLPDATGEMPQEAGGTHVAASPAQVFTDTRLRGWR